MLSLITINVGSTNILYILEKCVQSVIPGMYSIYYRSVKKSVIFYFSTRITSEFKVFK